MPPCSINTLAKDNCKRVAAGAARSLTAPLSTTRKITAGEQQRMSDNNFINDQLLKQYREQGYFTVEGLFTAEEVEGVREEIPKIVARYPDVPEELVQIEPTVASGEKIPESFELGVRKLSRMARHNEFFRNLAFHPKMVEIAKNDIGAEHRDASRSIAHETSSLWRRKDLASRQRLFSPCAKPCVWLLGGMR